MTTLTQNAFRLIRLVLLLCSIHFLASCSFSKSLVELDTPQGTLLGLERAGVHRFFGIPFAEPPVGQLRWQAPQPAKSWKGIRQALVRPKACQQGGSPSPALLLNTDEDCLYLNVWTPTTPGPHPVMVWIHGGGFMLGSGSEFGYSGENLAQQQDVIVVTINYRLSYFGYLTLPQFDGIPDHQVIGNQGMLDQVAALQWVKESISHFGGDPDNVTVFGESAGSVSICMLLASPLADNLFHNAILQSGTCDMLPHKTVAEAESQGLAFLNNIGCKSAPDPIGCAYSKSHEEIFHALGIKPFELFTKPLAEWSFLTAATMGTEFLPDVPYTLLENSNKAGQVNLIIGTNADEGSMFDGMRPHAESESTWPAFLEERYPGAGDSLATLYPYSDFNPSGEATAQIVTDSIMTCPSRSLADLWSTHSDVYFYHFTQDVTAPIMDLMPVLYEPNHADIGTAHSTEIPYIFGVDALGLLGVVKTNDQKSTRSVMQAYWGNFSHTGNPNHDDLPEWPSYTDIEPNFLELNSDFPAGTNLRAEFCDFWQSNPVSF